MHPPKDIIALQLDKREVCVGSDVTGRIQMIGSAPVKSVHLILECIEYTVVAFPEDAEKKMSLEDLKKYTTEKRTVLKQEVLLDCAKTQMFRFSLANNLPTSMRYLMEETEPMLPSQCTVTYTLVATVYGKSSKAQVIHNLVVLPQKEPVSPTNPCISVSIGSTLEMYLKRMFSCGEFQCSATASPTAGREDALPESAPGSGGKHLVLAADHEILHFSRGEVISISVKDPLGLLSNENSVWMIRLSERRSWQAQGRATTCQDSWDLCANEQAIPSTLRCTYDHDPRSLLIVFHEVIIYLKRKEGDQEVIVAATQPIPVKIA